MEYGKLGTRIFFHDWEPVLQRAAIPAHRKESWAITIRWYLSWAKRARVPIDFDSARDFMAQVEIDKHPSTHRLEQWKEALRWFFREGKRRQQAPNEQAGAQSEGAAPRSTPRPQPRGATVNAIDWRAEAIRVIRVRKYSYSTEQSYLDWLSRFAQFVRPRDPVQCGEPEVRAFLDQLAVQGQVSASTQRQALHPVR